MYGKFFASAFTGSMYGAGPDVFAVWGYVIANTQDSQVELNPLLLAGVIGTTPERIADAIAVLCAPDAKSRSKVEGGRRLIREGEFAYRVPNFAAYRAIKNEDDRREYNRKKKAEQRLRDRNVKDVKARVIDCQPMSAHAETEAESRKQKQRHGTTTTWLTPYLNAWEAKYGKGSAGTIAGRLAKALKPLHDAHGPERVLGQLAVYLSQTEAQYASPQAFAQKFEGWGVAAPAAGKISSGRAALQSSLQRHGYANGIPAGHREVPHPVPRALPNPRGDGTDG